MKSSADLVSNERPRDAAARAGERALSLARRVMATDRSLTGLVARLALGLVIFPHGAQHLLGWFGGYGYDGTRAWMVSTLGVPAALAGLAIVLEVVAPVLLVLGLGGRAAAAWLAAFLGIAGATHASNGFFMNWLGKQPGEGFEYHILAVALAVVVLFTGSGALSLDRALALGRRRPGPDPRAPRRR